MSFIGSLDQFDLSIILQKIEEYRKTGLLIVKQDETAVELSFRHGQLMCIGPVKPGVTLGARLVQTGVISTEACYSIELALGERGSNEYDAVNAFIDAHYLSREGIIQWATNEASQVLDAILAWEEGDLYFEENQLPSAHRYLVPLSIASLLPAALSAPSNSSPIFSELTVKSEFTPGDERHTDALPPALMETPQPQRVTDPLAPVRIDPSLIQPNMTLAPVDLSAYRESNPQVLLTPEQWRLFTRANGETTLSIAAHELGMTPDQVCRVACELEALGLVTILSPSTFSAHPGMYPAMGGMGDSARVETYDGPRYADVAHAQAISYRPARQPIETLSQWGNGGNGATFQLGSGWVVSPTPPPFPQQPEPEYNSALAQAS